MTPYNEDSFLASFESMSIGTQFSVSLNEGNIFPLYTLSYGQPSSHPSGSISEENEMINYPHDPQCHSKFHIKCNKDFKRACGGTPSFLSMERLWVGVKTFIHDIFEFTINIIGAPCLGMNIVFIKMGPLHQIM